VSCLRSIPSALIGMAALYGSSDEFGCEFSLSDQFRTSFRNDEASYDKLVALVGTEEKARARISDSLEDLQEEMDMLMKRRFTMGRSSATKLCPDSSGSGSGGMVEVLCACGCGEKRMIPAGSEIKPVNIDFHKLSPLASSGAQRVIGKGQRAYFERLAKPRPKQVEELAPPPSVSGPRPRLDLARLHEMSLPRELLPTKDPSPRALVEVMPRLWKRCESEPVLTRMTQEAQEELSKLVGSTTGAVGPAMRPPPRRALKLKTASSEDHPGLSDLLRVAERRSSDALVCDRDARRFCAKAEPFVGLDSPPAWQTNKVRSLTSQKSYLDSRLYPSTVAKPGSVEALNQRLEQLRRERFDREGQVQVEGEMAITKQSKSRRNSASASATLRDGHG